MVPQKNDGNPHDFENDPIETHIEDGWVKANGTTLGADDGLGAAAAMAVLEATDVEHGPIEALFTIDEETGMTGANLLKPGVLHGDILLNMDSETEGELYVGCAGGIDNIGTWTPKYEDVPAGMVAYKFFVKGLKGGHSGMDINLGRANANKVLNTMMLMAAEKYGLRMACIDGGSLRNAIPREAMAIVVVPEAKKAEFEEYAKEYEAIVKEEFEGIEPEAAVLCEPAEMPKQVIDLATQDNLFCAIARYPNGVIAMSNDFEGTTETSSNLATIKMDEGKIVCASLTRSLVDADKDDPQEPHRQRRRGLFHRRLPGLEAEPQLPHPQHHEDRLQGEVRQRRQGDGHPRRTGMRHPRLEVPELGYGKLRPDLGTPPLPRRSPAHRKRRPVLGIPGGDPEEHPSEGNGGLKINFSEKVA